MRIPGAADGLVRRQVRNMDTCDEYECRLAERDFEIAETGRGDSGTERRDNETGTQRLRNGISAILKRQGF